MNKRKVGVLDTKNFLNYFVLTVTILLYSFLSSSIAALFISGVTVFLLFFNKNNKVFFWCTCSYFVYVISTSYYAIIASVLVVSVLFYNVIANNDGTGGIHTKSLFLLIYVISIIVISYKLGTDPQLLSALLLLINVLIFVLLKDYYNKTSYATSILDSFWDMAYLFCGCTLLSLAKHGFNVSRLEFEGNVRDMANSLSIVVFLWICFLIERRKLSKWKHFVAFISTVLLLLTLSKGAIFGIVIGLAIYLILSKKINTRLLSIIFLIFILAWYLQKRNIIDFSRFTQRNNDLNGRTDIWQYYFDLVKSKGIKGILFGLGPGNVKRLASDRDYLNAYAHSTFFDFYYSYGLSGLLSVIICILSYLLLFLKKEKYISVGLIFTMCASFFVTGAATNTQLFIIIYLALLLSNTENNDMIGENNHA